MDDFIPPLSSPYPSGSPQGPPVIPSPLTSTTNIPPWVEQPRGSSNYPVHPNTPQQYSPAAFGVPAMGFIPPNSNMLPQRPLDPYCQPQAPQTPFGAGPANLPPGWPPGAQQAFQQPPGWAAAAAGLGFGAMPGMAGMPMMNGMQGMAGMAGMQGMQGMPGMAGAMPYVSPGMFPGVMPAISPGMMPGGLPNAWAGPSGYPQSAFPYGGGGLPTPAPAAPQQWPHSAPVGPPANWGVPAAAGPPPPLDRGDRERGDRMDRFAEGDNYGAVLTPLMAAVVEANVKINPLLTPLPDNGSDRDYLQWNMLFPSGSCGKSSDRSGRSWIAGRGAPATYPRLSSFRIVTEILPWVFTINASNAARGVTCGDVIDQLHTGLYEKTTGAEYANLPRARQSAAGRAYRHNRSVEHGVPGGVLGEGMRRIDYLEDQVVFAGIEKDDRKIERLCGVGIPLVFYLRCQSGRLMSLAERRQQEERLQERQSQEAEERSRANPNIRVIPPTEADDDDDDD